MLAAQPVITEIMASNQRTLRDGWGGSSDWIEIFNAGDQSIDLEGWHLTDRRAALDKWTFPPVELPSLDSLVVFASGSETVFDPDGNLHASFRLTADGEYLALVDDQMTVQQEFSPSFPTQRSDISYGFPIVVENQVLIDDDALVTYTIPSGNDLGTTWTQPGFVPDEDWVTQTEAGSPVALPLGFDHGSVDPALVAHWSLDDSSVAAGAINELTGVFDGQASPGIQFERAGARPDSGHSLAFDGESSVSVPFNDGLSSESFTWTAWVQPSRLTGRQGIVSSQFEADGGRDSGFVLYNDNGRWAFWTAGRGVWERLNGPSVRQDTWTHLAISFDQATGTKTLHVDGRRVARTDAHRFAPNPARDLHIGAGDEFGEGLFFAGLIDHATLYARALSTDEIRTDMNSVYPSDAIGRLDELAATDVSELRDQNSGLYVRSTFNVVDPAAIDRLVIEARYDDGFVTYVNGVEIARRNAPVALAFDSPASASRDFAQASEPELIDLTELAKPLLRTGVNVLALHGLNRDASDADFLWGARLIATESTVDLAAPMYYALPTPAALNSPGFARTTNADVVASHPSGSFETALNVTLESDPAGLPVYFTVDGSLPTMESLPYAAPITMTASTQIRARVIEVGALPGEVSSWSYSRASSSLTEFTSQLPIMVIENYGAGAVPNAGWNQTNTNVQQVPRQPASLMLFEPGQGPGQFAGPADLATRIGVRVRGAFSSSFEQPGYSVEGWGDEVDDDTSFSPLGMSAAADWVLYAPNPAFDEALIDNTFMFEVSNQMGHWAPQARYVELFLNVDGGDVTMADYQGLYVIIEKVERGNDRINFESFATDASSGGWLLEINRMDSITEDGQPPKNFHTAGRNGVLQTSRDLTTGSSVGDDIPRQYNAYINYDDPNGQQINDVQRDAISAWLQEMEDVLYGRAGDVAWNHPLEGYAKYIDVDSFIDYLILHNLSKNGDGLLLSMWLYNPDPSNGGKLTFGPIWDVDLGSFTGNARADLMRNADRLWYGRMREDPDFRQRYVDRWSELRAGSLATENLRAIVDGFEESIGSEAASRDRVTNWISRLSRMKSWLATRVQAIDGSMVAQPGFEPPNGAVQIGSAVNVSVAEGDIYLTFDGSDPRGFGGEANPSAVVWDSAMSIVIRSDTAITARARVGNEWSAPIRAEFEVQPLVNADLNRDGVEDVNDVDLLCTLIRNVDPGADVNVDGLISLADLDHLLAAGWSTTAGDADLNGVFNSSDLVAVFLAGRYEQPSPAEATWAEGDWNCDGKFTSSDLVRAFSDGAYTSASVAARIAAPDVRRELVAAALETDRTRSRVRLL